MATMLSGDNTGTTAPTSAERLPGRPGAANIPNTRPKVSYEGMSASTRRKPRSQPSLARPQGNIDEVVGHAQHWAHRHRLQFCQVVARLKRTVQARTATYRASPAQSY